MTTTLRVLHSFPATAETSNPYLALLSRSLADHDVQALPFTWTRALTGRYDLVHLHWPEAVLYATTPVRRLRKQLMFALWMARLVLTRTPVVRTVHNVEAPQGLPRATVALLSTMDRLVSVRVRLNPFTPVPDPDRAVLVPHGHYRDWIADLSRRDAVPGRIAFAGQVRRYKGLDHLVAAYRGARDLLPGLTLEIGGAPSSADNDRDVRALVTGLPDVTLTLEHLSDAELVRVVTEAELVVLPYRLMHNSGTVLYALSLARPVLVPDNEVNRALSDEVGAGWVHLFRAPLTGQALADAVQAVRAGNVGAPPNLSARDWKASAAGHVEAYQQALRRRSQ